MVRILLKWVSRHAERVLEGEEIVPHPGVRIETDDQESFFKEEDAEAPS